MGSVNNIVALIFLVALTGFEPSHGFFLGIKHFKIVNSLEIKEPLMVHCWSNGTDFGTHNLKYKEEFLWDFWDLYIFHHLTVECEMEFNDEGLRKTGNFVVYDSIHDVRRRECYQWCIWSVGIYGLYAYDEVDNRWDYEIPWPVAYMVLNSEPH